MSKTKLSPELQKMIRRNKTPAQLRTRESGGNNPNSTIKADENRREAYRKYLEEGKNQYTIAKEMGVTQGTVSGWINHEYEATKMANSNSAAIVREQSRERLERLINRFTPLAMHESLDVSGDEVGKNGEIKHIEIEAWKSSLEAAKFVTDAISKLARIYGLEKVSLELPKGGNLILNNNTLFLAVRNAVDKSDFAETKTIEGEFKQLE